MRVSTEREIKLLLDERATLPDLDGVGGLRVRPVGVHDLTATYWDTPSARLGGWSVTLRHRDGTWTLKLPHRRGGPLMSRQEIEIDAPADRLPPELLGAVRPFIRHEALAPIAELVTHRETLELATEDGEAVALLTDDRVAATGAGVAEPRFREIEIELGGSADERAIRPIVKALVAAGAERADARPKLSRALGTPADADPELSVPKLPATPTAREVIVAATAAATDRLVTHLPLAWFGGDPEGVHQARVASRRLRSDLSTWGPLVDRAWADPLRAELGWLGGALGAVRDLDVLVGNVAAIGDLHPEIEGASLAALRELLETRRRAAREELRQAMTGDRALDLLDALIDSAADPPTSPRAQGSAATRLQRPVRRRWVKIAASARRLPKSPSYEALHGLRISAKRVRYAAEAVRPAFGTRAAKLAGAAAELQDALGDLIDASVATEILREVAAESGAAAFAAGQVSGIMLARGRRGRDRWRRRWKRLDTASTRRWLEA